MLKVGDYAAWGTIIGKITKIDEDGIYQLRWGRGKYSHMKEGDLKKHEVSVATKQEQVKRRELIAELKQRLKEEESKILEWL